MIKWSFRIVIGLVFLLGITCFWVVNTTLQVDNIQAADFHSAPQSPELPRAKTLKILNWNVQFMAGNVNNHFFYDNGPDDWPEESVLEKNLDAMAALIREEDPDVIFLQEMDEGAGRTFFQNQVALLLDRLPVSYQSQASTYYWQADFLPLPAIWGRVGMKLATLSKYKIKSATRYALAPIDTHSWIEQQFEPRRAILQAELALEGGGSLYVLNTHLSAFAQGSQTMERQVSRVVEIMQGFELRNENAIIGGDFNLIPSNEMLELLPAREGAYYNPERTELLPLLEAFASVPAQENFLGANAAEWYTHSPNYAKDKTPNKLLDYFFMTDKVRVENSLVRQGDAILISDHMPLVASFSIGE